MSHCQLAIFMNITIIHIPNWHISKLILTEAESLQGAGLGIWSSTSLVAKIFTPGSCEKHLHCQNSVTFLVLDYNIVKKKLPWKDKDILYDLQSDLKIFLMGCLKSKKKWLLPDRLSSFLIRAIKIYILSLPIISLADIR